MNGKHNVGKRVSSFELYDELGPITGIALLLDNENELIAGDDSGYMLEVSCPFGTQAIANNLLASFRGKTYQGFRAENAVLDPTAELGDDLLVNGVQSVLAHRTVTFGPGHMSEIEAPGESTMEHEFQWKSPEQKEYDRKLATTRSLIEKTAEQIRLSVEGVENEISYIQLGLDNITSRVQDAEGNIAELELTANSLRSKISGKLDEDYAQTLIEQALEGIELSVSSKNGSTTFKLTADGTTLSTKTLDLTVDAVNISGTLTAAALIGRTVGLLTADEDEAGGIEITGASTATYAIELYSNGALRLEAYRGAAYLGAGDAYVHVQEGGTTISNGTVGIDIDDHVWVSSNLFPLRPDSYLCGNANFPWSAVWSTNGMCETSARSKKKNIVYGLDRFDAFFDDMKGCSYQMVNGTSGRFHNGFIADDIRDNLAKHGIPTADFGGYVEDKDEDGNPVYALRYSEFVPLLVDQVQKLKARVAKLEGKKHEV